MPIQSFFKYPSTPYLIAPSGITARGDKVLPYEKAQLFFSEIITVEEKIDGANLGISFAVDGSLQLQNRGNILFEPFQGQWKPLSNWLRYRKQELYSILLDRYILFGEWCYITHSIFYNSLPDWFIAFDVYDKYCEQFLSVARRNHIIDQLGLTVVPQIYFGRISDDMLDRFIKQSAYGNQESEGLYLRIDSTDHLQLRAKYVRKGFSQAIETHWSKKKYQLNQLCISSK